MRPIVHLIKGSFRLNSCLVSLIAAFQPSGNHVAMTRTNRAYLKE